MGLIDQFQLQRLPLRMRRRLTRRVTQVEQRVAQQHTKFREVPWSARDEIDVIKTKANEFLMVTRMVSQRSIRGRPIVCLQLVKRNQIGSSLPLVENLIDFRSVGQTIAIAHYQTVSHETRLAMDRCQGRLNTHTHTPVDKPSNC